MTFEQDTEITPVIFRKMHKSHGDNVMAIFPTDASSYDARLCGSYEHVGQHGSCEPYHCTAHSRRATSEEYADLKAELEGPPYGYRLKVYARYQYKWTEMRRASLEAVKYHGDVDGDGALA